MNHALRVEPGRFVDVRPSGSVFAMTRWSTWARAELDSRKSSPAEAPEGAESGRSLDAASSTLDAPRHDLALTLEGPPLCRHRGNPASALASAPGALPKLELWEQRDRSLSNRRRARYGRIRSYLDERNSRGSVRRYRPYGFEALSDDHLKARVPPSANVIVSFESTTA